MAKRTETRRRLMQLVPPYRLVTRTWLISRGMAHHTADNLVKRGELEVLRPGVYANPGQELAWEEVVCSVQRMGSSLIVGGDTALDVLGRGHYIPLGPNYVVNLYGPERLPRWINDLGLAAEFRRHGSNWLRGGKTPPVLEDGPGLSYPFVIARSRGRGGGRMYVSTPERAYFEILGGVPAKTSFEHAELLLDGMPDLLPHRLNGLLVRTRSVKVKRLFFWLAKRQRHPWLAHVPEDGVDFGSGKRQLAPGGRLNREYQITVPDSMSGETRELL